MKRINARYFLEMPVEEMEGMLAGNFTLVFDDGELDTNDRETLYSGYAWDFHRAYPKTPLLMKHHIKTVLTGRRMSIDADLRLLGNAMWSAYDAYKNDDNAKLLNALTEMTYAIDNKMYNDFIQKTESDVTTIDLLDFMEVLDHPDIFEANAKVQPTPASIGETYDTINKVLRDSTQLVGNSIAGEYRSNLIKAGQVLQCVGPRGRLTDMDSRIFQTPITRGYAVGVRSLYDSMIEARSASKSSFFSGEMLEQSEYFSRRLQFVAQTVQHLHHTDCGATQYLPWKIRDAVYDKGNMVSPSDLKLLHGKHYMDDDGVLKTVTPKDRKLIGRKINLRSVLYCAHPDPMGICSTCFGELADSVPEFTNIGQLCSTYMAKQSSQNILSNKHLDQNATLDPIKLDAEEMKYLKVGEDNSSYLLSPQLKGKSVSLVIDIKRADSLMDIFEVPRVEDLTLRHVIELDYLGLLIVDATDKDRQVIDLVEMKVEVNKRMGSFTYPMLQYLRDRRWTVDKNGNYVVDMSGWDWDQTILILPQKHFNMSDHADEIANMLESRVEKMRERDKAVSADVMIVEFFDYVNWKLEVNLAALEVILYSTMIVSAENNDYSLPKPWTDRGFGVQAKTMENRSLSVKMAYQDQLRTILSPSSYLDKNRVDHIFDGLLMPHEVFGQHE